jgi:hypothetical protein
MGAASVSASRARILASVSASRDGIPRRHPATASRDGIPRRPSRDHGTGLLGRMKEARGLTAWPITFLVPRGRWCLYKIVHSRASLH